MSLIRVKCPKCDHPFARTFAARNDSSIRTVELKDGGLMEIHHDDDPMNPRTEYDNLGTMVCFHNRYDLGDKHDYRTEDYADWEELRKQIGRDHNVSVILPLFLFDHSGITISTDASWFRSCDGAGWDWGQVGWIFITEEQIAKGWPNASHEVNYGTNEALDHGTDCLVAEVETYDQYLRGDIYGFIQRDADGEDINSCWGFFGSDPEENGMADGWDKDVAKQVLAGLE